MKLLFYRLSLFWSLIISVFILSSYRLPSRQENTIMPIYERFNIDPSASIEVQINQIINLMTLDEKIGQMTQVRHFEDINPDDITNRFIGSIIHTQGPSPGEGALGWQEKFRSLQNKAMDTRLGIPLLFAVDAIHGQNTYNGATIFPHNIGMGATHNPNLIEKSASITALETQATGFNWTFSPCIAIPYNEKWGRVYEAYSESTDLTSEFVSASIKGYQGNLTSSNTVLATAKHFIGDGSTDHGKEGGSISLSMQEISSRLLPPYKQAVKDRVGSIMVSFSSLSGIPIHAHKELLTDTLKGAMGFDGIVVSDWKGYSRFGRNDIINAGVDLVMAVDGDLSIFQTGLKNAVRDGQVSQERINDAVRRILRQKFRLGLFQNPYPDSSLVSHIGKSSHRMVAKQAVRESLVLLKHHNNVLPIDKNCNKIVVVGEHADNVGLQSGGWTIAWQGVKENYSKGTTILEGIKKVAQGEIVYDPNASLKHEDADVVIIVVGETPYAEFMGDIVDGNNSHQLILSEKHQGYLDFYANSKSNIITILISGRPLIVTKEIDQSDAFIAAWLPGSEGDGIAEVLFGEFNFKGRLPHSWPKSFENFKGKYGPNFWDKSNVPLFELGYGLKY